MPFLAFSVCSAHCLEMQTLAVVYQSSLVELEGAVAWLTVGAGLEHGMASKVCDGLARSNLG